MELIYIILIIIGFLVFLAVGYWFGRKTENQDWLLHKLDPIIKQRLKMSRSVIGGQLSEQIAPYLPEFGHLPSEVRFIGKPIDFLVFKGMDKKEIEEVIFVEVKSGKSKQLSSQERKLRDVIKAKKVRWEQYNVPENINQQE